MARVVRINGNKAMIEIALPSDDMSIGEQLLGASQSVEIRLKGYDEIGRGGC